MKKQKALHRRKKVGVAIGNGSTWSKTKQNKTKQNKTKQNKQNVFVYFDQLPVRSLKTMRVVMRLLLPILLSATLAD
ncbi:hypothetical protein [Microbulbifer variabilis]|uniref:hypothetical protein n=1 Tax=Microbulbifer variabilis TaxID=266805 RepID=UPI001CFD736E|nr:hypothetical protein [Microbulbifer variabilis]